MAVDDRCCPHSLIHFGAISVCFIMWSSCFVILIELSLGFLSGDHTFAYFFNEVVSLGIIIVHSWWKVGCPQRAFLVESWVSSGGGLSLGDTRYCRTFLHLWVPQFAQSGWWVATEISLSETSFSWLFTQIWLLQVSSSGWGAAKEISCSETKCNWTFFQPWLPKSIPNHNDAQSKKSASLKPVMTKTFPDSDCPSLCLVNNEQPRNSASVILLILPPA